MKQFVASVLRKAGLIYVTDFFRFYFFKIKYFKKNRHFLKSHAEIAFPSPYMIYETFRLDYQRYFEKGKESAIWIKNEISPFKRLENCSILDWGCGPARVLRHLPEVINNNCSFYGTDYNEQYIVWCNKNIPNIIFKKNELTPPLPFENDFFDLAYGLSIFTHLSEENHFAWINELVRVLKHGGILMITTHGVITKSNLLPKEAAAFDCGELVVRADVKEGHRMFTAFQPEDFMKKLLGDSVKILKHHQGKPQSWGLEQDTWIVQKQ